MLKELPLRQRGECCEIVLPIEAPQALRAVDVLKALAEPTRLQIAAVLLRAQDPVCVCDLTAQFELSQPTISHHMAKLREAGLVESTKRGIWAYYRLREDMSALARRILEAAVA